MRRRSSIDAVILITAALAGLAGVALTITARAWPAAGFDALAAVCAAVFTGAAWRRRSDVTDPGLITKLQDQVDAGRKLAIFERETGLFAHWYLELRGVEECTRAARYGHPLVLLLVECARGSEPWVVAGRITDWIRRETRAADIAGYVGNARFVVLMPETSPEQAALVLRRVRALSSVEAASSCFGDDGVSFEQLYTAASSRLGDASEAAA